MMFEKKRLKGAHSSLLSPKRTLREFFQIFLGFLNYFIHQLNYWVFKNAYFQSFFVRIMDLKKNVKTYLYLKKYQLFEKKLRLLIKYWDF